MRPRPSTGTVLIVVIVCGLILGGLVYSEATSSPSPLCGGCIRYYVFWCLAGPCPGREALNFETSQINSPTNMSLSIRNTGEVGIWLDRYSVKNSIGNQYTNMNWTTPLVQPNQIMPINIVIDGSTFTFQPKNTYTISLTTTRNNTFTFTISV